MRRARSVMDHFTLSPSSLVNLTSSSSITSPSSSSSSSSSFLSTTLPTPSLLSSLASSAALLSPGDASLPASSPLVTSTFLPSSVSSLSPSASSSFASSPLSSSLPFYFGDRKQFLVRKLEIGDYKKGFLTILTQLALVGPVTFEMFEKRFLEMQRCGDTYNVTVIEDIEKQKIIACATLLLEIKFIHKISSVAHIEDVVVDQAYRGYSLGLRLMQALQALAVKHGCYKILLDCDLHNVPFYNKSGYSTRPTHMVNYLKNPDE